MKPIKSVFIISVLLISSTVLSAQPPKIQKGERPNPPPIPTEQQIITTVDQLTVKLSLSEEQKNNMLDLHMQHFKILKEKMCADRIPDQEEMQALRTEFETHVKAILTEEQQIAYDSFMEMLHTCHPGR